MYVMKTIQLEPHDPVVVLRLSRGVTNAINLEMVSELSDALADVADKYRGLILAGGNKFFSIGLDLPALVRLDRDRMADFLSRFHQVILSLYTLPIPTACAMSGHATAGGTILALGCDYRFITRGKCLMGLNEIRIGLPVPYLVDLLLRQIVGDRVATEMAYTGELVGPEQADASGLVDRIFSKADLEPRAIEKIAGIASSRPDAFSLIKKSRVKAIEQSYRQYAESSQVEFLDCWFQPEVRQLLRLAAEKY
ncbi:MAG: hypothetical protein DSY90_08185 [Deltaproteobacteria bacterium]|nr:MAG: hypothetical protein DSY90_08185 [Deltaproteobacteria bacterium]